MPENSVTPYISMSNWGSSTRYSLCALNSLKYPYSSLLIIFVVIFIKAQDHSGFIAGVAFLPSTGVIFTFRLHSLFTVDKYNLSFHLDYYFVLQCWTIFVGEMSSESEKDKERLVQAAKMFFFHMQDLVAFTNTLIELFNSTMNTQIHSMNVKEDAKVKDVFEQIFAIFKELQSVLEAKYDQMQKEPLCSKIATAVCSMVEQNTSVKELQQSAKEMFKNVHTPVIVAALNSSNILGTLESSLSLLMTCPIMNLQLSDLYRKDTEDQSNANTLEKDKSPGPSKIGIVDILKKLQDALKAEHVKNTTESVADQLEQIVKTLRPILELLQKAINTMESKIPVPKKASDQ